MGSESDCLLGQFESTLWISDSEAGLKVEKSGGVVEGEGECGDDVVWCVPAVLTATISILIFEKDCLVSRILLKSCDRVLAVGLFALVRSHNIRHVSSITTVQPKNMLLLSNCFSITNCCHIYIHS